MSVDKSDRAGVIRTLGRVVIETHKGYQDVELSHNYVDNAAMQLVRNPRQFDVNALQHIFLVTF